jgi:protein TonB
MDYARQQRDPARHMLGIGFVILIHALVIWALVSGLGKNVIQIIKKPLNATIVEEVKLPPPPPPPPPPPKKIVEPPPKLPPPIDTYVPPPDIPPPVQQSAPVITQVAPAPPPEAYVIPTPAPPAVVAPPAPPKPAVRRGIVRLSGDDPTYPREAIRAGVQKGRVVARLQIDEKGNVTDVNIVSSEPRGVFDRVVRIALEGWKFRAEGEKYVGEVEINFTLKDE